MANILAFAGVETLCDAVTDPIARKHYYALLIRDNRAIASYKTEAERKWHEKNIKKDNEDEVHITWEKLYTSIIDLAVVDFINANKRCDDLRRNKDIARAALNLNIANFIFVSEECPGYADMAKEAVGKMGLLIKYIPHHCPGYADMAKEAVGKMGFLIRYIPHHCPGYADMAKKVFREDAWLIKYIHHSCPGYDEMARDAIRKNPWLIENISSKCPIYDSLFEEAIKIDPAIKEWYASILDRTT